MLAITGPDHGCGALVFRAGRVQLVVEPRRARQRQRREKRDESANADAGARLHATGETVLAGTIAQGFFEN